MTDLSGKGYVAPYLPSSDELIELAFELAKIQDDDTVVDLGCGDARLLIRAVQRFGCKAIGYELDEVLVQVARRNVVEAGDDVFDSVQIVEEDLYCIDLQSSPVTVLILYLLPEALNALADRLKTWLESNPQKHRLITNGFPVASWTPIRILHNESNDRINKHVHLYTADSFLSSV
eukprot:Clim_evm27s13 gene=Clim_evmTU27s13